MVKKKGVVCYPMKELSYFFAFAFCFSVLGSRVSNKWQIITIIIMAGGVWYYLFVQIGNFNSTETDIFKAGNAHMKGHKNKAEISISLIL